MKKMDADSKRIRRRISYFKLVLDETALVAKVRMGTSEANKAYRRLEETHRRFLVKFGSERQTTLESADAEQGVRQGLIDAAMRFDPTRREQARFGTVAYNWCYRNSRARHFGQKRPGVYAPSIEGMDNAEEGIRAAALITRHDGALGTFTPNTSNDNQTLKFDLAEKIAQLPKLQRDVVLCELRGLSTSEIVHELSITKVRVRKARELAYAELRASLAGYAET